MCDSDKRNDENKKKKGAANCALGVSGRKNRLFPAILKAQAENSKAAEEEQAGCGFRNGDGEIVNAVGAASGHGPSGSASGGGVHQPEVDCRCVVEGGYRAEIDGKRICIGAGCAVPCRVRGTPILEDCQVGTKLCESRTVGAVLKRHFARPRAAARLIPSELYPREANRAALELVVVTHSPKSGAKRVGRPITCWTAIHGGPGVEA